MENKNSNLKNSRSPLASAKKSFVTNRGSFSLDRFAYLLGGLLLISLGLHAYQIATKPPKVGFYDSTILEESIQSYVQKRVAKQVENMNKELDIHQKKLEPLLKKAKLPVEIDTEEKLKKVDTALQKIAAIPEKERTKAQKEFLETFVKVQGLQIDIYRTLKISLKNYMEDLHGKRLERALKRIKEDKGLELFLPVDPSANDLDLAYDHTNALLKELDIPRAKEKEENKKPAVKKHGKPQVKKGPSKNQKGSKNKNAKK